MQIGTHSEGLNCRLKKIMRAIKFCSHCNDRKYLREAKRFQTFEKKFFLPTKGNIYLVKLIFVSVIFHRELW